MSDIEYIETYFKNSIDVKQNLLRDQKLIMTIHRVAQLIEQRYREGKKLLIAGNGGSAADSQHIAAEFVSRFYYDRPGLPAIALTTDTSMLTAIGNDYGFDSLFARQVQAQGAEGDVFIGISTSGKSKNIISAIIEAKKRGLTTVAFCGLGGEVGDLSDIVINVPSTSTPFIQECHICVGHVICGLIEQNIFPREDGCV